jgi:hypothetical protein
MAVHHHMHACMSLIKKALVKQKCALAVLCFINMLSTVFRIHEVLQLQEIAKNKGELILGKMLRKRNPNNKIQFSNTYKLQWICGFIEVHYLATLDQMCKNFSKI